MFDEPPLNWFVASLCGNCYAGHHVPTVDSPGCDWTTWCTCLEQPCLDSLEETAP